MYRKSAFRLLFLIVLIIAGALSFGQTKSMNGDLIEDDSLERTVPITIEKLGEGQGTNNVSPPLESPQRDNVWNLFDADTRRAFASRGNEPVHLRLVLDGPRTLHALSAFGGADGELSLLAELDGEARPIDGLDRLYLNGLGPAWHRWTAETIRARVLIVEWVPFTAGAALPEIELWTYAENAPMKNRIPALDAALHDQDVRFVAGQPPDLSAGADAYQFRLRADPRTFERVFLVYDLEDGRHYSAALRSINGLPPQGGLDALAGSAEGLQIEEIHPRWLRRGLNEIHFDAAANLHLAIVTRDGRHLVKAAQATALAPSSKAATLVDGDLMTGWDGADDPQNHYAGTVDLPMKSLAQPHTLELDLADGADGVLIVEAVTPEGAAFEARPPLELASLGAGLHRLGLYPDLPVAYALRLSWQDRGREWTALREVDVLASPVGPRVVLPSLTLSTALLLGEADSAEEGAYLRGFVESANAGGVEVFIDGDHVAGAVQSEDGAFGLFVPRSTALDSDEPWEIRLEAVYPDGTVLEKTIWLDGEKMGNGNGHEDDTEETSTSSGEGHEQVVRPDEETVIEYDGIRMVIPPGAVDQEVTITIDPLSPEEVAELDTGMNNVTAPFPCFRLGPDGMRFNTPITLTLAYDPALMPDGLGDQDIQTYFFDEEGGRWLTVDRLNVKSGENMIVSQTDHFTDFINATLTLPDSPSGTNFNPNSLKDLQLADPSSGISLIAAPAGQASGDAELSFPIDLPPGRLGQTPDLSVAYTSSAGNSWLGLGWDLPAPSITADVVFGVPRYSTSLESETYLLNGRYLAPTANLITPDARVADRVFTMRIEGSFQRIVRWGDSPDNYWWEVTDKNGTRFIYGQTSQARLRDYQSPNNTFRWFLEQVIDPNGNSIDYTYWNDTGTNGEEWTQLYLSQVDYTGASGAGTYYSVSFHLDDGSRVDKFSSGLGGFKVYTRYRLDHVDVSAGGTLVRRYQFQYREGDFAKSLLDAVAVIGADGTSEFHRHSFDYFSMPTQDDGFDGFQDQAVWGSMGSSDDYTDTASIAGGAHGFIGVGPPGCATHVGVQAGFEVGTNWTQVSFVDVNGDGLPDRLDEDGGVDLNQYDHSNDSGSFTSASMSGTASPLGAGDEHSFDVGIGLHALGEAATVGVTYVWNHNSEDRLIADVNGDGFADLVDTDGGFTARLNERGESFGSSESWGGFTLDGVDLSIDEQEDDLREDFRLGNTLRKLILPYSGTVTISGAVQKIQATAGDGIEVSIYRNSSRIWHRAVAANDTSACEPASGDACGNGLVLDVSAGQRLYFMVSAVDETSGDDFLWEPRVAYTHHGSDALDVDALASQEPYGAPIYTFDGNADFRLAGSPGGGWTANAGGTVLVFGSLAKEATADDVTARVTRNGSTVYSQELAADEVFTLDEVPSIDVESGDVLEFLLESDAQVDPDRVSWTPSVTYEGGTFCRGVPGEDSEVCGTVSCDPDPTTGSVTCEMPGDPAPEVPIQEDEVTRAAQVLTDVYELLPRNSPTEYWEASEDGDYSFRVSWQESGLLRTEPAYVFMQGVHHLYAKRTVDSNSSSTSFTETVTLSAGDRIYFTSIADSALTIGSISACLIGEDDDGNETCTAVSANARYRDDEDDALSGGYHSWYYGEWNGNVSFSESGFNVDEDDENADFAAATPHWEGSDETASPVWTASSFDLYLTADGGKPSRLGANVSEELDSLSGGSGPSMLRKGYGHTIGVDASLGVNLSLSLGYSVSQIDFLDMNADQYPDQVTDGQVRFSNGVDGFSSRESITNLGTFRRTEDGNFSQSVGLGITFTKKKGDGKPKEVASTMPSVGSATAISQDTVDLVDVNGDGLPDRVSMDPGDSTMSVRLNLGYRFGSTETWPLPSWDSAASDRCREVVDFVGSDIIDLIGDLDDPNGLSLSSSASLSAGLGVSGTAIGGGGGVATTLARSVVELADINGDSLPDHVYKDDDEDFFRVKINQGDSWSDEMRWYVPSWSTSLGDGYGNDLFRCFDAVSFSGNVTGNGSINGSVCIPLIPPVVVAGLQLEATAQANGGSGGVQLFLEDIDGDGLSDHILKKAGDGSVYVKRNNAGKVNLLRSVTRPLGGSFALDYRRQGNRVDYSNTDHLIDRGENQWVLASSALSDGRGNTYTSSFEYFNDAFFDRVERQEYGFARVHETRPDGSTVDTRYHNQDFYRRNLAFDVVTRDAAGRLFKRQTMQYESVEVAANSFFPALLAEATFFYEGTTTDETAFQKSTLMTFAYDAFGNVIRFTDFVDEGPEDDAIATINYHIDPSTHIMKPSRIEVRNANGQLLRGRSAGYDGAGRLLRLEETLIGGRNPATGASYTGSDNAVWNLTYDAFGNLASIRNPEGFTSNLTYDATTRTHVTGITDSFGYSSSAAYNLAYGLLAETTDKNGHRTQRTYDIFGRLLQVTGPYDIGSTATIAMEYGHAATPAYAVTHHKDVTRNDPIDTVVFVDGLVRTLQTKRDHELDGGSGTSSSVGMQVSGRVEFDTLGRVSAVGQPIFDRGALTSFVNVAQQNPTRFTYDVLDRTVNVGFPNGGNTVMAYGFQSLDGVLRLSRTRTDAEDRTTRTYSDVTDVVVAVEQSNTIGGTRRQLVTRYAYNAMVELTGVTDPGGNGTTVEYDTLGRRTVIDNSDAGSTEMRYDRAGNLGARITANLAAANQQIRYLRTFNRLDRIDYPNMPDVVLTYGEPGAPNNRADRIATIADESGLEERSYGRLGEIVAATKTATALNGFSPKGPYTTTFEYDSFNRLLGMTYPDGEELSYSYDAGGKLQGTEGVLRGTRYSYIDHLGYDEFGQRARVLYGNGVESRYTYTPEMRRLSRLVTVEGDGREVQDLRYDYNRVGTILGTQNDVPVPRPSELGGPSEQSFRYDDLYQLVGAEGSYRFKKKTSVYSLSVAYDEIGNITTKNRAHDIVNPGGKALRQKKTSFDWTYDYGGAQPHAATHLGDRTFFHDRNGNQIGWDHDRRGTRRTVSWDEENRVKSVADNGRTTRFLYSAGGERTNKQGQHGETIYVNQYFTVRNGAIGSKHIFADQVRVVSKVAQPSLNGTPDEPGPTEDKRYWYHGDHLSSANFVTDKDGELYQHHEYFPFGEQWVAERSESQRTPYLFSGKELDEETGLYYFGARYYEPRQSQWISPDPILGAMLDNESLATPDLSSRPYRLTGHLYAYVANSPINLVDPTGLLESDSVAQRPRARSLPAASSARQAPAPARARANSSPSRVASSSSPPPPVRNAAPVRRERAASAPLPRRASSNDAAPVGRQRAASAPARLSERGSNAPKAQPPKNEKIKRGIKPNFGPDGATSGSAPPDHVVNVFSGAPGAILEATPLLDAREALNLEAGFAGGPVRELDDGRPVYEEERRRTPGEGQR